MLGRICLKARAEETKQKLLSLNSKVDSKLGMRNVDLVRSKELYTISSVRDPSKHDHDNINLCNRYDQRTIRAFGI